MSRKVFKHYKAGILSGKADEPVKGRVSLPGSTPDELSQPIGSIEGIKRVAPTSRALKKFCTDFTISLVGKTNKPTISTSLGLINQEEHKTYFAPVSNFKTTEFLERLVKQMIFNRAVAKGLIDNDCKDFLF